MGLPAEIAASLQAAEPEGFAVWPENMPIVDAWQIICTQWRAVALADGRVLWMGLDYASAKVMLDCSGTTLSPSGWSGLRLMERVAAATLNGSRG